MSLALIVALLPLGAVSVSAAYGDYNYTMYFGSYVKITGYNGIGGDITIPSHIGGYPVTVIEEGAFSGRINLTSVRIGSCVNTIGAAAFYGCDNLANVTISSSVTTIEDSAFGSCKKLTNIVIPDNVTYIGKYAFEYCNDLESITIGKGVTRIKDFTFRWCKNLANVILSDQVTTIENSAFSSCDKLTNIVFPKSVTTIGKSVFAWSENLTSVTIPSALKTVDVSAFEHCTYLTDVYYYGTEVSRENITINDNNAPLLNAEWHYLSCNHVYADATCTKAKTCKICGATIGSKLGHSYKKVVTKATTTKNGSIKHVCTKCGYTASKTTTIYKASKVSLSDSTHTYTGNVKKPSVVVKDSKGKTISSKYYTVTYASGRKNVGKYKVTVKFKGNYSGTKTLTFKINPAKTTLGTLTAAKKALTVKWTKKPPRSAAIRFSTPPPSPSNPTRPRRCPATRLSALS